MVSGPTSGIRFDFLGRPDGVPTERIYQVLEDRRGFLWFTTTNGLARYDGYQHVLYPGLPTVRIPPLTASLPGLLFEDRRGSLWAATTVLTRFDAATGKFGDSINPRGGPPRPGVDSITAVHDAEGSLWVGIYSYGDAGLKPNEISEPVLYEVKPDKGVSLPYAIPPDITAGKIVTIRSIESDKVGPALAGHLDRSGELHSLDRSLPALPARRRRSNDVDAIPLQRAGLGQERASVGSISPQGWSVSTRRPACSTASQEPALVRLRRPGRQDLAVGRTSRHAAARPVGAAGTRSKTTSLTSPAGLPLTELDLSSVGSDRQGNVWVNAVGAGTFRYSPALARFGALLPDRTIRAPSAGAA